MALRDIVEAVLKEGAASTQPEPASPFPAKWRVPESPRRQQELQMWKQWKDNGEQPEHLEPLLKSMEPLVQQRVRVFAGRTPIPTPILHSEATRLTVQSLKSFNPEKAQLATHVTNNLKGLQRYVISHQNVARVTESRAARIGDYDRAKRELEEELSRPPTTHEVADRMQMPVRQVVRMQQEIRADNLASISEGDPFLDEQPRMQELIQFLPYELTDTEKLVFEYLTGTNGKKKLNSTGAIARELGWSDSKASQVRTKIALKIRKFG